jgi:hypothetical protein
MEAGSSQTLGPACFARFGLEAAKAILPAEEIAQQLGPIFVQPPSNPHPGEAGKRRGRKASPAPAEAKAAKGKAGRPPEVAAAAENE